MISDWVDDGEDGYKHLTIRGFEALAVEALREFEQENADLQARVAELESVQTRLAALAEAL